MRTTPCFGKGKKRRAQADSCPWQKALCVCARHFFRRSWAKGSTAAGSRVWGRAAQSSCSAGCEELPSARENHSFPLPRHNHHLPAHTKPLSHGSEPLTIECKKKTRIRNPLLDVPTSPNWPKSPFFTLFLLLRLGGYFEYYGRNRTATVEPQAASTCV